MGNSRKIRFSSINRKAQVALEYMFLISVTTIVVLSILGISTYYTRDVEDSINTNQLDMVGKDIVDKAESVYYFGEPSKATISVFIPKGIRSINVSSNEVSFRFATASGESDMFYKSNVPLQGTISSSYGFHNIIIEAKSGYVWINGT
jgi:uncharacterized protein (UPF0333 family)